MAFRDEAARQAEVAEDRRKMLERGVRLVDRMRQEYDRALVGSRYADPQDALMALRRWAMDVETMVLEPEVLSRG
jgi:hypothetical protein